jgi:hypothetical protein
LLLPIDLNVCPNVQNVVARRQMVSFAVDSQTTMVESNEKPYVTPAMLSSWVTFLLGTSDADSAAIANKVHPACHT